ncbi:MAG: integrase core domain-containing protein [Coriobacteriia bacterium]|nr:integrase core domain-containing protein [Coriobacteriia bacterium]
MDLARNVVEAVLVEGRIYREVARAHGVSKSWVGKVVSRFREGGYEALAPRSRAPSHIPHRASVDVEDVVVRVRRELSTAGFDAGAATIHFHLTQEGVRDVPSVSTIWRILKRRGLITPQPHKRPRSSWVRFEASLPNERWPSDVTHWKLANGEQIDILNFLDDHSRLITASKAFHVVRAPDVLRVFCDASELWGSPASVLTDNGCVYTAWHRRGINIVESEMLARGIVYYHSRPYHPQTCGKVERFHQTLKGYLVKQETAKDLEALQAQIDTFFTYYNDVRPHRARGRMTPRNAFEARDKARPSGLRLEVDKGTRVRRDRIDSSGVVTLRCRGKLHHIGVGRAHKHKVVIMLIADLDVRILTEEGEVLRHLTLDPTKNYQAIGRADVSTMS